MVLKEIKIEKYKGILEKTCVITSEEINIYIGENNVGKSTILEVISLIGAPKISNPECFPKSLVSDNTIFEYKFDSNNEEICIRQEYSFVNGAYKAGVMYYQNEKKTKKNIQDEGIQSGLFIDYLKEMGVPEVFYISPQTSDSEFSALIDKLVKMQISIRDEQLQEFNDLQDSIFETQIADIKTSMGEVALSVSSKIDGIFSSDDNNYEISIDSEPITEKKIKDSISISSKFNQLSTSLHGTGFQRALILLLIKEAMLKGLIKHSILVIDEPEAFIHPNGIEALQEIIYDIAGLQIIISTHSPLMISIKNLQRKISVLRQLENEENRIFVSDNNLLNQSEKEMLKLQNIANSSLFEFLFARKVVVVEGDAEEYIFKVLLEEEGEFTSYRGTTKIINSKGKGTIQNYLKILNDYCHDYSVCFDLDNFETSFNGNVRAAATVQSQKTMGLNIFNLSQAIDDNSNTVIGVNGTLEYALTGTRIASSRKVENCLEILTNPSKRENAKQLLRSLLLPNVPLDARLGVIILNEESINDKFTILIS